MRQTWVISPYDNPTGLVLTHTTAARQDLTIGNQGTLGVPFVIPANTLVPGQLWRTQAKGTYSTSGTTPTLIWDMGIGTTIQHATVATTLPNTAAVEFQWQFEYSWKCITIGKTTLAAGIGQGQVQYGTSLTAMTILPVPGIALVNGPGFDSTVANVLSPFATFSASASTNRITLHQYLVELLN